MVNRQAGTACDSNIFGNRGGLVMCITCCKRVLHFRHTIILMSFSNCCLLLPFSCHKVPYRSWHRDYCEILCNTVPSFKNNWSAYIHFTTSSPHQHSSGSCEAITFMYSSATPALSNTPDHHSSAPSLLSHTWSTKVSEQSIIGRWRCEEMSWWGERG